jgi:hypothetical protein
MESLIWNCRGISNPIKIKFLSRKIKKYNISLLILIEPFKNLEFGKHICNKLNFEKFYGHELSKIWILYKKPYYISNFRVDKQCIHLSTSLYNTQFFITIVYASYNYISRRELWGALNNFSNTSKDYPWLICGDFNCITDINETLGGAFNPQATDEFNDCIHSLGLLQPHHHGNVYSWSNNQGGDNAIFKRLDRCLINTKFCQ